MERLDETPGNLSCMDSYIEVASSCGLQYCMRDDMKCLIGQKQCGLSMETAPLLD